MARLLRDAEMEVVYTGLFQTPEMVANSAVQEDVDVVGLSMLSGAHITLVPLVIDALRRCGSDIVVVIGGIIPPSDILALLDAGVAGVMGPGASGEQVVAKVRGAADTRNTR